MCRSRRELSNAYLLAKFGFDTASRTSPVKFLLARASQGRIGDGSVFDQFAKDYLGGLQKHPLRETAQWRISTEETKLDESTTFNTLFILTPS